MDEEVNRAEEGAAVTGVIAEPCIDVQDRPETALVAGYPPPAGT